MVSLSNSEGKNKNHQNSFSNASQYSLRRKSSDFSIVNFDRHIEDTSIGTNMVKHFQDLKTKRICLVIPSSNTIKSTSDIPYDGNNDLNKSDEQENEKELEELLGI